MIRHIVAFSAKNSADVPTIRDELARMRDIPGVRSLEVRLNAKRDGLSTEMDVVLDSTFDTWADLAAYQDHPDHHAATAKVRPLRDQRIVLDYEI